VDRRAAAESGVSVQTVRLDGVFIFGLALWLFKSSPANHQAGEVVV
jgi:hypothetical protein